MQSSLAERLRLLRAREGLSLLAASEQLGVDRHTLRDLELGQRRTPRYPTLAKIAKGYGVPVEDLLEEPVLPLDEAPPVTGQQLAPEAMPGTAGGLIEVRIGEDESGTHVEVIRTPFLDLFRKVRRGQLSPEEAAERAEEATKRALRSVS